MADYRNSELLGDYNVMDLQRDPFRGLLMPLLLGMAMGHALINKDYKQRTYYHYQQWA
jgi:hypothetical protein